MTNAENAEKILAEQALSVVMSKWGTEAIAERNALLAENKRLKDELELWKGPTQLPVVGKYYTAPEEMIEQHGWEFFQDFYLRYDKSFWKSYQGPNGMEETYVHQFTAPFKDDNDLWIKFFFETYELHQLLRVEWENEYSGALYVDSNDQEQVFEDNLNSS